MTYELFYYRPVPGRTLRDIYQVDISTTDSDEATLEPYRIIDKGGVAAALTGLGFVIERDEDAFNLDPEGHDDRSDKIELVHEGENGTGAVVAIWDCHMSLHVPLADQHPGRDVEVEGMLRRVSCACHDQGLMGYDPKHDRELTPANLHVLAEEITHGEATGKPWWKLW